MKRKKYEGKKRFPCKKPKTLVGPNFKTPTTRVHKSKGANFKPLTTSVHKSMLSKFIEDSDKLLTN